MTQQLSLELCVATTFPEIGFSMGLLPKEQSAHGVTVGCIRPLHGPARNMARNHARDRDWEDKEFLCVNENGK